MINKYLLIALRNIKKYKGSFLINLIGLSTGLASVFFIYLWVKDEMNFDRFHTKSAQLYQVMELSKENDHLIVHEATQGLLAGVMAKDLPEVEAAIPVFNLAKEGYRFNFKSGDKIIKADGMFAGKDFLTQFTFPLITGTASQALAARLGIVITETMAVALFGSPQEAMGKSVTCELIGMKMEAQISGVTAALPDGNSMKFDFILPYEVLLESVPNFTKWWNEGPSTYLVLKKGTDTALFNAKIKNFLAVYHPETIFTLFVRNYADAYLYSKYENGVVAGGRISYVRLFSIIAIFILVIACINFMNLSTAKASRRMKEVGVRKAVGSTRADLIFQFLLEAVLMAVLSLITAVILVFLLSPAFNAITGKNINIGFDPALITAAVLVAVFTGLVAGSYPAFYLSGFNPVEVLKGKVKNSLGELLARKGLVVFQFIVSLVLIIAVLVIQDQIKYVQQKNLGYDKANVLYFDKEGKVQENSGAFMTRLKNIPGVLNASTIQQSVVQSGGNSSTYGIDWPGKTEKDLVDFIVRNVDYNLLETLGITITQGRSFSPSFGSDSSNLIFNETAIKVMRLKDPVGKTVNMWGKKMQIAGVVKDFHISSLHEPIAPMVFRYDPAGTVVVMAKIAPGKEQTTIAQISKYYREFNLGYPFAFHFLDGAYQAQYVSEQRVASLSKWFAGLAMLISFLGLFGLAAFNAEVRTKEMGIRKVLGASVSQVMYILSLDFFKLVLIAVLVAFPLSWLLMNAWLEGFAYRTAISTWIFVIALISIIIITLAAVITHALKAAWMNPVKSLRTE